MMIKSGVAWKRLILKLHQHHAKICMFQISKRLDFLGMKKKKIQDPGEEIIELIDNDDDDGRGGI